MFHINGSEKEAQAGLSVVVSNYLHCVFYVAVLFDGLPSVAPAEGSGALEHSVLVCKHGLKLQDVGALVEVVWVCCCLRIRLRRRQTDGNVEAFCSEGCVN